MLYLQCIISLGLWVEGKDRILDHIMFRFWRNWFDLINQLIRGYVYVCFVGVCVCVWGGGCLLHILYFMMVLKVCSPRLLSCISSCFIRVISCYVSCFSSQLIYGSLIKCNCMWMILLRFLRPRISTDETMTLFFKWVLLWHNSDWYTLFAQIFLFFQIHFRSYPSNTLTPCKDEEAVKWSFINSLKEVNCS